ncbi:hypothetical protein LTR62_006516 [Meristemomyces frigidus]|uniref:Glycosyl transferase CAP10 domain-containing protein n=1 Tax=Meristemomyces frigidus TaxID=1508187 RepID=A0AAN7YMT0_9PEZI|nr:hypothetical protein LTR62_006516 [Meristemomyces frigidus]
MDQTKWPGIAGLVASTTLLCRSTPVTFAFDKPVHTSIAVLASCACAVIGVGRLLRKDDGRPHKGQHYDAVPLGDMTAQHNSTDASPSGQDVRYPSSLRKLRILFMVLVGALCLRVELLREIVANVQCATTTWETFIPFILALADYWTVRRHEKPYNVENLDSSVYDAFEDYWTHASHRYVSATALLSFGSYLALRTTSGPQSTYICATALPYHWIVPTLQHLGTLLDVVIIFCIGQLLHQREGRGQRSVVLRIMSVGWSFLSASLILASIGTLYYVMAEQDRKWIATIPTWYFWSTLRLDLLICFFIVCTTLCIYHIGVLSTSAMATFVATASTTTAYTWNNPHPYPHPLSGVSFIAICLVILGFATYLLVDSGDNKSTTSGPRIFTRVPSWLYVILLTLFLTRTTLWASHKTAVAYHPIDILIYDAQTRHETYRRQTSSSQNISAAANKYAERYGRLPPPGFQHWYAYATARNSVVIDDFDSIDRDIRPFFALAPEEIRERTWQLISNPWNDAAGISIRDGQASISPNVVPTHRWMLDGLVEMISKFAEFLPDMDLAFNLNDECRVAVPYDDLQHMLSRASIETVDEKPKANHFSEGRVEQWKPIPEEPMQETPLHELSWQPTFYDFGSAGCPESSPARSHRQWNVGNTCTACTHPHSLGAFLANWTLAGNVCHQPDLANLHGIYLSPAAFKASHELYPIFSQSKVHGFNDILYPSAWNYIDKAKYAPTTDHPDPPFSEKNTTLFWRGATSEGVSDGRGQWRGMTRQRFVHLSNPINGTGSPQPLLLPQAPLKEGMHSHAQHTYHPLPLHQLTDLLSTSIHIVDSIARCAGPDCLTQAVEFAPLVPATDFQHHWRYKYLLDLDGAGFSGRFLPFLHSHSLPFKAGLFREWWDDRVQAWQHFVPLDVRGQGMWATLAYFAGVDGVVAGREVVVAGREAEGERIAERGRNWAGQVLRKEDMEIYFFRLLLEWGRVTDDGRVGLGFGG